MQGYLLKYCAKANHVAYFTVIYNVSVAKNPRVYQAQTHQQYISLDFVLPEVPVSMTPSFLFSLSDTSPRKIFFTTQDELAVSTNTISLQWEGHNDLLLHWKSNLKVGFCSRFQEEKSLIYWLRKLEKSRC